MSSETVSSLARLLADTRLVLSSVSFRFSPQFVRIIFSTACQIPRIVMSVREPDWSIGLSIWSSTPSQSHLIPWCQVVCLLDAFDTFINVLENHYHHESKQGQGPVFLKIISFYPFMKVITIVYYSSPLFTIVHHRLQTQDILIMMPRSPRPLLRPAFWRLSPSHFWQALLAQVQILMVWSMPHRWKYWWKYWCHTGGNTDVLIDVNDNGDCKSYFCQATQVEISPG